MLPLCATERCHELGDVYLDAHMPHMNVSTRAPDCYQCCAPPVAGKTLLRCSRCKARYYCSEACQRTHWLVHKEFCKKKD
jgi:hypothetical protein